MTASGLTLDPALSAAQDSSLRLFSPVRLSLVSATVIALHAAIFMLWREADTSRVTPTEPVWVQVGVEHPAQSLQAATVDASAEGGEQSASQSETALNQAVQVRERVSSLALAAVAADLGSARDAQPQIESPSLAPIKAMQAETKPAEVVTERVKTSAPVIKVPVLRAQPTPTRNTQASQVEPVTQQALAAPQPQPVSPQEVVPERQVEPKLTKAVPAQRVVHQDAPVVRQIEKPAEKFAAASAAPKVEEVPALNESATAAARAVGVSRQPDSVQPSGGVSSPGATPGTDVSEDKLPFWSPKLSNPKPSYPRVSQRLGEQGTVKLSAWVNTQGRVQEVKLLASSGHRRLDQAAMQAVRQWAYELPDGKQMTPQWLLVPVTFDLLAR